MIYVTSDLHFCHNRDFIYEPRGFPDVYSMNEAIIKNWNRIVQPADDVYLLGDIMLNDDITGLKHLKNLKGNIHIILGNHDTTARIEQYHNCWNVVEIENACRLKYHKYNFFLTHYPCITSNYDDGKSLKHKTINLCGHIHTKDPFLHWQQFASFHCEMDTNNCTPWLLDDIIQKMENYKAL